ncbi:MAG TPA: O-antigen ligase family protein [Solirubrobacterales bacterium]
MPTLVLLATAVPIGLLAGADPKLALVAVLALGFAAVVLTDLTLGLCMFAVISFLDVLPFGGIALTFAKVAGFLLVLSWMAGRAEHADRRGEYFGVHPVLTYLIIAFLAWGLSSMLWAEDPSSVMSAMIRYGLNLALFVIVFAAVRSERAVTWVAASFLIGSLVAAAFGLLTPADPASADDISRLGGGGNDPNELAAVLVTGIVFAAAFLAGDFPPLLRLLAIGAMGVCATGVLLSFSRTGLVALAVALMAAVLFGGRWRQGALVLLIVLAGGVTIYIASFAGEAQRERVTKLDGGTGRQDIWTVGMRMIEANPTSGVGAGNFPVSSVHYLLQPGAIERAEFIVDTPKVAHNIFIEVWAELGLVGFALFMAIVGSSVTFAARAARAFKRMGNERMELFARAILVSQLAFLSAGFFLSEEFSKQLWLLLALGPAIFAISRSADDRSEEAVPA